MPTPIDDLAGKTLRELAVLCHEAEETDDDVLLMQVQDEVQRRGMNHATSLWMDFYREEWTKRMQKGRR